jgi:rare lipoprotein A (peptidoglycan hydrolase)
MPRHLLLLVFAAFPLLLLSQSSRLPDSLPIPASVIDSAAGRADSAGKAVAVTVKADSVTYREEGIASWYGNAFDGRMTSSGETFRPDSMTAAHKTLPFGTLIRVTNLKNDSVVIVKVTDRLPKSSKRCIDLTSGAAKKLNFLRAGLTPVKLEVIGTAPIYRRKKK